jgi:adenylate cyclase, class 2
MPLEIEVKLRISSHDAVRQKLRELRGSPTGRHLEVNTIFDSPNRSLFSARKALRVRVSRDLDSAKEQAILTFKGPRQTTQFKSREEIETYVSSPESMTAILNALDFTAVVSFEKKRESWNLDGCHVELDELPYLGKFVEIEGPSEAAIANVQRKLGLSDSPPEKSSYVRMLMTWLESHRIPERVITFPPNA